MYRLSLDDRSHFSYQPPLQQPLNTGRCWNFVCEGCEGNIRSGICFQELFRICKTIIIYIYIKHERILTNSRASSSLPREERRSLGRGEISEHRLLEVFGRKCDTYVPSSSWRTYGSRDRVPWAALWMRCSLQVQAERWSTVMFSFLSQISDCH